LYNLHQLLHCTIFMAWIWHSVKGAASARIVPLLEIYEKLHV